MSKSLESCFLDLDDTPKVRSNYLRAPFGYPGSKLKSLNHVLPHLPYRDVFVEHFGGSGVITLNRQPSKLDVFNDRYSGIVSFYRCIREPARLNALIERLELTIHSREEFIWCKDTWERCEDDVERAARWYCMIQMSVVNKGAAFARSTSGKASVPERVRRKLKSFLPVHWRFKNVQVENLDWQQSCLDYDSFKTVHYFDPPYLNTDVGVYTCKFSRDDHVRMVETIATLDGFCAVSGYPNDLYDGCDFWTDRITWDVKAMMKVKAQTRTNNQIGMDQTIQETTECLWIKE